MTHRRRVVSRELADQIRDSIIDGTYPVGTRLPSISEMATSFGVSVPSVREAIHLLQSAGLLNIQHGKGVFVRGSLRLTPDSLRALVGAKQLPVTDVYEARIVVEIGLVRQAIERITSEEIEELQSLVQKMRSRAGGYEELADLDTEFHLKLALATKNVLLAEVSKTLLGAMRMYDHFLLSADIHRDEAIAGHEEMVEAIGNRDVDRCVAALRGHLERGLQINRRLEQEEHDGRSPGHRQARSVSAIT